MKAKHRRVLTMRWIRATAAAVAAALLAVSPAAAQHGAPADGEWRSYAGDSGSTKYSPLDQITADNFGRPRGALALDVGRHAPRPLHRRRRLAGWRPTLCSTSCRRRSRTSGRGGTACGRRAPGRPSARWWRRRSWWTASSISARRSTRRRPSTPAPARRCGRTIRAPTSRACRPSRSGATGASPTGRTRATPASCGPPATAFSSRSMRRPASPIPTSGTTGASISWTACRALRAASATS